MSQTFIIADEDKQFESDLGGSNSDVTGRFVTSIDLFFSAKDDTLPITVEIRNVVNGYPGSLKFYHLVELLCHHLKLMSLMMVRLRQSLLSNLPVYLQSMSSIVLLCCQTHQNILCGFLIWGKRIPMVTLVAEQPHIGVLFKGHNNRAWVAAPTQDAKFTLRAAKLIQVLLVPVSLTNETLPSLTLGKNPLVMTNGNTALKVNHFDNQMHSTSNNVTISGVKSGAETTLNGAISSSATTITLPSGKPRHIWKVF